MLAHSVREQVKNMYWWWRHVSYIRTTSKTICIIMTFKICLSFRTEINVFWQCTSWQDNEYFYLISVIATECCKISANFMLNTIYFVAFRLQLRFIICKQVYYSEGCWICNVYCTIYQKHLIQIVKWILHPFEIFSADWYT